MAPDKSAIKIIEKDDIALEEPPSDYFKFGKAMLWFWGLWPKQGLGRTTSVLYNLYGITIICTTLVPFVVCFVMDIAVQCRIGHWRESLARYSVALAMFLGVVKLSVYVANKKTIEVYMAYYEGEKFTYKSTSFFRPNDIIKRCVYLYNVQVVVCFGLLGILASADVETLYRDKVPYFDDSTIPALPLVNWLPYDFALSPYYELSFGLTNFWFFVSADIIFVYDTICMGLMIHTGGQIKILRKALKSLRERAVDELYREGSEIDRNAIVERSRVLFKKSAVHHQAIIEQTAAIQRIFSPVIFLQFFTSCLMVCFTILVVTNVKSPVSSRITSLIILSCTLWELSVYCYFGNEIVAQSNRLSESIYTCDWIQFDKSLKTSLMIMMCRAQRPIVVTVGRFIPLSLETFVKVLKASYTYYAFLRNVADNE